MRVALTVADFLNRAALVYGHRVAVVDEPSVPGSYGTLTYGELESRARGMALALDDLGVDHGERVAIVSPNSGRFLTAYFGVSGYGRVLVPINFRLTSDEIAYVVEHSGASVLLYDPDLTAEVSSIKVAHRFCLDGVDDAALFAPADGRRRPEGLGGRRGRDLLGELHVGDHGATEGRAADAAQLLAQRGDLRVAHRSRAIATCSCTRCPCSTATVGACPTR